MWTFSNAWGVFEKCCTSFSWDQQLILVQFLKVIQSHRVPLLSHGELTKKFEETVYRLLRNVLISILFIIILIHKCRHQVNEVTVRKMKTLSQYWVTDTGHGVHNNSMDTCLLCLSSAWLLFVLLLQTEQQCVGKWSAQWCHVVTRVQAIYYYLVYENYSTVRSAYMSGGGKMIMSGWSKSNVVTSGL